MPLSCNFSPRAGTEPRTQFSRLRGGGFIRIKLPRHEGPWTGARDPFDCCPGALLHRSGAKRLSFYGQDIAAPGRPPYDRGEAHLGRRSTHRRQGACLRAQGGNRTHPSDLPRPRSHQSSYMGLISTLVGPTKMTPLTVAWTSVTPSPVRLTRYVFSSVTGILSNLTFSGNR